METPIHTFSGHRQQRATSNLREAGVYNAATTTTSSPAPRICPNSSNAPRPTPIYLS